MLTRVPLQHEEHSVLLFTWTNESQMTWEMLSTGQGHFDRNRDFIS